jgi:hypothetical protein
MEESMRRCHHSSTTLQLGTHRGLRAKRCTACSKDPWRVVNALQPCPARCRTDSARSLDHVKKDSVQTHEPATRSSPTQQQRPTRTCGVCATPTPFASRRAGGVTSHRSMRTGTCTTDPCGGAPMLRRAPTQPPPKSQHSTPARAACRARRVGAEHDKQRTPHAPTHMLLSRGNRPRPLLLTGAQT